MAENKMNVAEFRRDFFSLFEGNFVERVRNLPEDIMNKDEVELIKEFTPKTRDYLIRKRITELVKNNKDLVGTEKLEISRIYEDIMMSSTFYTDYTKNLPRLAWATLPLESYQDIMEDAAYHGIMRMRKAMMTMELNEKTLSAFAKMVEFFNIRAHGVPVQRLEQRNLNLHVSQQAQLPSADTQDILAQYNELKAKIAAIPIEAVKVEE